MIINFLGDSITEGYGASSLEKRYSTVTCSILDAKENNYGIAGTRIAPQYSVSENPRYDLDFISRVDRMTDDCDTVVIFGGTNDFGHGDAPFGKKNDTSDKTFCGAVYTLFNMIKNKFPNKLVVVILPLHRSEENNKQKTLKVSGKTKILSKYRKQIERMAKKFNFNLLDLWNDDRLNPHLEAGKNNFTDMLHPSDSGHKILAERLAEYIQVLSK